MLWIVYFRRNFISGSGDSMRVDQGLQPLIYLTTFRFASHFSFSLLHVIDESLCFLIYSALLLLTNA